MTTTGTGPGVAHSPAPQDQLLIIFGATGDLAQRKLLPGLFHLAAAGMMPARYRIIGSGLPDDAPDTDGFRAHVRAAIDEYGRAGSGAGNWEPFAANLDFAPATPTEPQALLDAVNRAEQDLGGKVQRLIYLAVPPDAFVAIVQMLGSTGLGAGAKLVIEKPFGHDLASAKALNGELRAVFEEDRIYRIDHFLGKEAVQNILAFRFGNGLFESVWNADHIDHVQIDVPERLNIEGRAEFYEQTGAYRDMVVTHLFHLLGFLAMEAPTRLDAASLHEQAERVFQALNPVDPDRTILGQYVGYTAEPGVAADSTVETFVALIMEIDNPRWAGVPFQLRTGKAMAQSRHTITLTFIKAPQHLFGPADCTSGQETPNELIFELSDPASISISFRAKAPGADIRLDDASLNFHYADSFTAAHGLLGYERLLHDAMTGDHTLFTQAGGIERLWELSAPLLARPPVPLPYRQGSWGPAGADRLIAPARWHLPEPRGGRPWQS
ncbi:glucose-6-phosphate 1-dehydrogenase [Arthrobacter sp. ok909]|uniref:glucose-6-phosphate dehydrogenase n=1 Tax=Arthrobacter sp. ok909 TaxID=1761746 RepID=UPI0008800826|nr:glucose-6-phosphate dehydrogenase [Arthrobacter sp. ok909]SDP77792.1 glucose-6-phosphate 1-dehydrogenase [Arthrobacter sp. ok909]